MLSGKITKVCGDKPGTVGRKKNNFIFLGKIHRSFLSTDNYTEPINMSTRENKDQPLPPWCCFDEHAIKVWSSPSLLLLLFFCAFILPWLTFAVVWFGFGFFFRFVGLGFFGCCFGVFLFGWYFFLLFGLFCLVDTITGSSLVY